MLKRLLLLTLVSAAPLSPAHAQSSEPEIHLVLGTATPGGSFPAYGEALVATVREVDAALTITLRMTKGSTENLALLKASSLDLALVQGEYAYEALGTPTGPGLPLTVVAPIDTSPGLFVVPTSSPIHRIEDLRGQRVALGTHGSGLTIMGRTVLRGSGIDPDHDIQPILLDKAGDGATMVLDGRAAALWGGSTGWPGFKTLADAPGGARFFGPAPQAVEAILALSPSLRRFTVPANSFKSQTEAIQTVGSWSLILARPGLADGAVTRLVRAIDRGLDALTGRYAQGRESDPRNLSSAVPAKWLHPATATYLHEMGALEK